MKTIIENAYTLAYNGAKNHWIVEPIGTIVTEYGDKKVYENVSCWLFWKWAILVKKRNRKFASAMVEFCNENNIYCSYSDYHKALYIGIAKWFFEYEKMSTFFGVFINEIRKNIDNVEIDSWLDYD